MFARCWQVAGNSFASLSRHTKNGIEIHEKFNTKSFQNSPKIARKASKLGSWSPKALRYKEVARKKHSWDVPKRSKSASKAPKSTLRVPQERPKSAQMTTRGPPKTPWKAGGHHFGASELEKGGSRKRSIARVAQEAHLDYVSSICDSCAQTRNIRKTTKITRFFRFSMSQLFGERVDPLERRSTDTTNLPRETPKRIPNRPISLFWSLVGRLGRWKYLFERSWSDLVDLRTLSKRLSGLLRAPWASESHGNRWATAGLARQQTSKYCFPGFRNN